MPSLYSFVAVPPCSIGAFYILLPTSMHLTGSSRFASPAFKNIILKGKTMIARGNRSCGLFYTTYMAAKLTWPDMVAPIDSGTTTPAYASCDHARWRATLL